MKTKYIFLVIAVALLATIGIIVAMNRSAFVQKNSEPTDTEVVTKSEPAPTTQACEGRVNATVSIEDGPGGLPTHHIVSVNGMQVLSIETKEAFGFSESLAELYRQTDCFAYIAVFMIGRGGYIFYSGPDVLYRIDLRTYESMQIPFDGFLMDISPDETMIAVMTGKEVNIIMIDPQAKPVKSIYRIPPLYNDAGGGKFSPDSQWFAYGAIRRDDNGEPVEQAMITIDLVTHQQTVVEPNVRPGYPVYVTGWTKGGLPITSDVL